MEVTRRGRDSVRLASLEPGDTFTLAVEHVEARGAVFMLLNGSSNHLVVEEEKVLAVALQNGAVVELDRDEGVHEVDGVFEARF